MSAIPYKHYPLDPPEEAWDSAAERTEASVHDLSIMCAWEDATRPDLKNSFKLPHHRAGTYHTNLKGVISAGNAIMGARGGVEIPKYDLDAVKAHLQKHYHEFGKTAPWENKSDWRWYRVKNSGGKVKDVDNAGRTVTGYFASFNTRDSDGDTFAPGCFAKSIGENRSRIMHLLQHNTMQPIGRPQVLKEDGTGLYFETPVTNTPFGNDVLQLYRDGVYNEHSVGFEMIQSGGETHPDGSPVNVIREAKLWEGSTVTWGANAHTPFTGFKNSSLSAILDEALERSTLIYKQLHRGNLQDETYTLLEIELKQLQSLLASGPAAATRNELSGEPENAVETLQSILNQF